MNNKTFLFEKNDWTCSRLTILGHSWYVMENKNKTKRYIRKSLAVVNKIIAT